VHPNLVDPSRSFVLLIDAQEAYRKALRDWEGTLGRIRILLEGARIVGVPILYTEQYPKGLGATAAELHRALAGAARFEKRSLSALGAPGLPEHMLGLGRRQVVVCGLETHACVSQTVHDLITWGFSVHVPADAVSSRRAFEHERALEKMVRSGALPTSVEQVLLELVRSADHPAFKPVQALLK
jgi:nicotinamidase-related amidase